MYPLAELINPTVLGSFERRSVFSIPFNKSYCDALALIQLALRQVEKEADFLFLQIFEMRSIK